MSSLSSTLPGVVTARLLLLSMMPLHLSSLTTKTLFWQRLILLLTKLQESILKDTQLSSFTSTERKIPQSISLVKKLKKLSLTSSRKMPRNYFLKIYLHSLLFFIISIVLTPCIFFFFSHPWVESSEEVKTADKTQTKSDLWVE